MGKLGLLCLPFEIVPGGWESYADLGKPGLADMHYTCGPLQCSSPLGSTSDEHCTSSRGNSLRRTQGLHDRGRPKSTIITWLLNNSWWKTMDCADPPACMPILQSARHHIGPPRRHIPEERCSGCSHTFACSCWLIFSIFFSFIHICIHIYIYISSPGGCSFSQVFRINSWSPSVSDSSYHRNFAPSKRPLLRLVFLDLVVILLSSVFLSKCLDLIFVHIISRSLSKHHRQGQTRGKRRKRQSPKWQQG